MAVTKKNNQIFFVLLLFAEINHCYPFCDVGTDQLYLGLSLAFFAKHLATLAKPIASLKKLLSSLVKLQKFKNFNRVTYIKFNTLNTSRCKKHLYIGCQGRHSLSPVPRLKILDSAYTFFLPSSA